MALENAQKIDVQDEFSPAQSATAEFQALRSLLSVPEESVLKLLDQRLASIENRVDDRDSRTSDVSEVLAEAISQRITVDDKLGGALNPIVVEQFRATSRDDPEQMAEALFPILGPAVRKMIVSIISPDKKSKKRTYRLEQLFLIHKSTGLPACHVSSGLVTTQDADVVSGMLNAIQSFVHDAFEADEFDGLNSLQIGELSVWIEWGPDAVLAAVVRGAPPKNLRNALQIIVEKIHGNYAEQLKSYEGDTEPFNPLKIELHQFLESHDGSPVNRLKNLPFDHKKYIAYAVAAVVLVIAWFLYDWFDSNRWNRVVDSIQSEAGIVVTHQERGFRDYQLRGLRDPLATDPATLLNNTSIKHEYVHFEFEPYQAIHPEFVLARAKYSLGPPAGVRMELKESVLHIHGMNEVNRDWARNAIEKAKNIVGINRTILNSTP